MILFVFAKEDCFAPEENHEPNSARMKSSWTRGVRHKSLEENHSAWIKKRSLIGHIMCSGETPKKILESNILTEVGVLYKVSPSKFVWSLDKKRQRGNLLVQRFNAVLATLKYVWISGNELVLLEMGRNLS